jgi:hypothetical protein
LLLRAEIQCLAESQPVAVVVAVFGTAPDKQARVAQAVAQDHQVQTAVDKLFKAATEPPDKDSQAELVVDSIVKAIINMPALVVVALVAQEWTPAMKDMNILRQTVAQVLHLTCWETYITLPEVVAAGHTTCLQVAELVV